MAPGGSLTRKGVFHLRRCPYKKLRLCFGNQRVLGVVGLPVGEFLNVGPLFVVLIQVTYPQEGSQHQRHIELFLLHYRQRNRDSKNYINSLVDLRKPEKVI